MPFGITSPACRQDADEPTLQCRCCGAYLSMESHRADCETLPDQDALEAREAEGTDEPAPATHTLDTNDGPVVVTLHDGQLEVQEYDQGCNPWARGPKRVALDAGPRWGKGWTVVDVDGNEHWYQSNWDSSD